MIISITIVGTRQDVGRLLTSIIIGIGLNYWTNGEMLYYTHNIKNNVCASKWNTQRCIKTINTMVKNYNKLS